MNRKKKRRTGYRKKQGALLHPLPRNEADVILFMDIEGKVIQANRGFTDLFGWKEAELTGRFLDDLDFIPESLQEEFVLDVEQLLSGKMIPLKQTKRSRKDGQLIDVSVAFTPVRNERQEIMAFVSIFREAPENLQTKKRLKESEQRYKSLFDYNPHAVYTFDLEGKFTSGNKAFEQLTGYPVQHMLQTSFVFSVVPEDRERVTVHFNKALKGKTQEYEADIIDRSGQRKNLHIVNSPIVVDDEIVGIYGIATNITDRKKDEEKLERLAFYDQTTGAANRHLFSRDIKTVLGEAKENQSGFALLHLNGDRFKYVNEALGMEAGDVVLKSMTARIRSCLPVHGTLYRLDGNDFYIILHPLPVLEEAGEIAEKIVEAFRRPWKVNSHELIVTASIGIALYPQNGEVEELLVKRSGQALDHVKSEGKNMYQFFDESIGSCSDTILEFEMDLQHAIERNEFQLFYQPKIDLHTERVIGAEALIRWNHPEKGMISPDQFIPLAEQNGQIYEITKWVLKEACRQSREWTEQNLPSHVSVNISSHHLYRKDLVSTILQTIAESGIQTNQLEVEITENGLVQNVDVAIETISILKKMGVRVSIDDFGTGFSSLSHLKVLPVDILKIDRSFIRELPTSGKDQMIVRSIIQLANAVGLSVVAEGVEEKEHLLILKELGCQIAQGFFISKPVPNEEYVKWLSQSPFTF
ncbi:sensor domain-containing protein [Domibacillus tundrae]|uniref:sensor domain-containing protein n=1 Tax=Domibacillus tundrae TaxID=1587527 RepID=UPI0033910B50